MTIHVHKYRSVTFSPELKLEDAIAGYWMRQVTNRLRREICWCRHQHSKQDDSVAGSLSPYADCATASLNMVRYQEEKMAFFRDDVTARYLTEQMVSDATYGEEESIRGSLGWVIKELQLDNTATFVLALGLAQVFDNAMGSVIAACLNDPTRKEPSLALAQKLWDFPERIISLADPSHPLFRFGLLRYNDRHTNSYMDFSWDGPIMVPPPVAERLLYPLTASLPACVPISDSFSENWYKLDDLQLITSGLSTSQDSKIRFVPLYGDGSAWFEGAVGSVARYSGRNIVKFTGDPHLLSGDRYFDTLSTVCWLRGEDLFLDLPSTSSLLDSVRQHDEKIQLLQSIPVTVFLSIDNRKKLEKLPAQLLSPAIDLPKFDYDGRVAYWVESLGSRAEDIRPAILDLSRRFRFEKMKIDAVVKRLKQLPRPISLAQFTKSCRMEAQLDLGELAQKVEPRFTREKLIIQRRQHLQLEEVERAMRSLTRVHYEWGTARAWNEGGISVLFSGSPGTGKTMAAEILAINLDLPMYRIDLSQVVNKYIGETEKNLKALFDAAETVDVVLFFDEADSLFGRRTEVKDAHDRYANLEISYLLDRMERFKGLAILATNRKKDLDEAFIRRLRHIIDFPPPGVQQRFQIWRQVIPAKVDCSSLDFDFLSTQFPLNGGHIRSIVFNACLQCACADNISADAYEGRLTMEAVIKAVKREYDKLNRSISLENFGSYAGIIREMESENDKS